MNSIKSINEDNMEFVLGSDEIKFVEGIVSEPMMISVPHTIALLKVDDAADIPSIKSVIRESVNPAKWVCVSVSEEQIVVDSIGNVIILIMDREAETLHQNFLDLVS